METRDYSKNLFSNVDHLWSNFCSSSLLCGLPRFLQLEAKIDKGSTHQAHQLDVKMAEEKAKIAKLDVEIAREDFEIAKLDVETVKDNVDLHQFLDTAEWKVQRAQLDVKIAEEKANLAQIDLKIANLHYLQFCISNAIIQELRLTI